MRDTEPRRCPSPAAARAVFDLALEGMVWSRRSLLMAVLLGLPVVFGVLYRAVLAARLPPQLTGFDLYAGIVAVYYVRNVLPLAALFYATSLVADEVEGKTLTYLLTRPVPRAPPSCSGSSRPTWSPRSPSPCPRTVVTFFLLATARAAPGVGAGVPDLFRDLGVMALTLLVYGAFFTLLGVAPAPAHDPGPALPLRLGAARQPARLPARASP